jgi:hypothetical protein
MIITARFSLFLFIVFAADDCTGTWRSHHFAGGERWQAALCTRQGCTLDRCMLADVPSPPD